MSITAARLQAEVGADTKGFDSGMSHADRTIKGAPSKWATALKVGGGAALAVGGALIVKGVMGALSAGITAIKEDQVVAAQTASVIKSTGGAAKVTAAQIDELAGAIQNKTAIEDKDVQAGANMLLTFTNIRNAAGAGNDIFTQSVSVLADLSTAMKTDMSTSAIQLGKALNDPIKGVTALQRVGVTFDAQQKKQITTLVNQGDLLSALQGAHIKTTAAQEKALAAGKNLTQAGIKLTAAQKKQIETTALQTGGLKAQKIILAELNKEFGGSGAAFGATDTGEAQKFGYAVEDIQKALAHGLMPTITKVRGALTDFFANPATLAQVGALGDSIAGIFSEGNLKTAASLMTTAAGAISTAIKLFSSLPPQVQALAVGALALKKITGIGPLDIVKGAGGVISMVFERGATPANPLFVADVAGGLGGKGGGGGIGLPGGAGAAGAVGAAETGWAAGGVAGAAVVAASAALSAAVAATIIALEIKATGMTPEQASSPQHGVGGPRTAAQGAAWADRPVKGSADRATAGGGNIPPAHGSADRATAGGGAVSIMATIPKNIMATLTAIGPGAAGVYQRGIHNGVAPSMATVAATVARNAAATAAVKAATVAAAAKTTAAYASYRAGERADLAGVKGAALASANAIRAKTFSVVNRLTIAAVPVTLTLNQRVLTAAGIQFNFATGGRRGIV